METITRSQWRKLHRDFKMGDPIKGTAKVLRLTEQGTCLVPVEVRDPSCPRFGCEAAEYHGHAKSCPLYQASAS